MLPSYSNQSLVCRLNQLAGFYVRGTLVHKGLMYFFFNNPAEEVHCQSIQIHAHKHRYGVVLASLFD